jgi:hypothetical protein
MISNIRASKIYVSEKTLINKTKIGYPVQKEKYSQDTGDDPE